MEKVFEQVYSQVTDANKGAVESWVRLNEIAARTHNQLTEQQIALLESYVETGSKQLQLVADAKDPKGYFSQQAALMSQLGERVVGIVQKTVEIQGQAREELAQLIKDGVRTAEAKSPVKATAKEAKGTKETKEGSKVAAA